MGDSKKKSSILEQRIEVTACPSKLAKIIPVFEDILSKKQLAEELRLDREYAPLAERFITTSDIALYCPEDNTAVCYLAEKSQDILFKHPNLLRHMEFIKGYELTKRKAEKIKNSKGVLRIDLEKLYLTEIGGNFSRAGCFNFNPAMPCVFDTLKDEQKKVAKAIYGGDDADEFNFVFETSMKAFAENGVEMVQISFLMPQFVKETNQYIALACGMGPLGKRSEKTSFFADTSFWDFKGTESSRTIRGSLKKGVYAALNLAK